MKKIITLFQRNYDSDHLVRDEVTPGAEWVLAGEGKATRKWDGTCCLIRDGRLYKRYTLKRGRTAPVDFEPVTEVDSETGKQEGWVNITTDDKWHKEALNDLNKNMPEGTYELVGPKIQGNPECVSSHMLLLHGDVELHGCPRFFSDLRDWFHLWFCDSPFSIEGVVWHHPDGRMVKIKGRDFGFKRKGA